LIHRDLNPRNILLTEDKKHCKISDFGLAKEIYRTFTAEGKGSLPYMAPEAIQKDAKFSLKTDVYAFGICMYEIWTGEKPYDGEVLTKLGGICQAENPVRPIFPASCDARYAKLAAQCWSFSPLDRPPFDQIIPQLFELKESITRQVYGM